MSRVNKGALLTEPWTEVLYEAENLSLRCEYCVEALWHLGKKSDVALLASRALLDAWAEKRSSFTPQTDLFSGVDGWRGLAELGGGGLGGTPEHDLLSSSFMNDEMELFLDSLDPSPITWDGGIPSADVFPSSSF